MQKFSDAARKIEHCIFSVAGPVAVFILMTVLLTLAWFWLLEISGVEYSIAKANKLISFITSSVACISYFIGAVVVSCAIVSIVFVKLLPKLHSYVKQKEER